MDLNVLGLHAAYTLAENGTTSVIVLEAQDRIGGRIHSLAINGDWIEKGAQWIHGRGKNPLWEFVVKNQVTLHYHSLIKSIIPFL